MRACPVPTRIVLKEDGNRHELDPAWIVPVTAVDPEISDLIESTDPDVVIRGSNIINIVAFSLAHNEFALRTGLGSILGIVEPQYCDPEPESMHRGVLGWLRANCRGIMIPTSDRVEVGRILRQMARLRSAEDDEDQADEIEALPSAAMPGSIIRRRMANFCRLSTPNFLAANWLLYQKSLTIKLPNCHRILWEMAAHDGPLWNARGDGHGCKFAAETASKGAGPAVGEGAVGQSDGLFERLHFG